MSDKINARIEGRTPYRAAVWLQPTDGASLVGETKNVSQGGMFVNVVPTPRLGQVVLCELPGYRAVRGRVVWVSMPEELEKHGVGIEFVDLSEQSTPILSMPSPTYAGLELHGPLDFLQAGAEVQLSAPSGHRQLQARVSHVELDKTKHATNLTLSLVIASETQIDDDWFPEITFEPPPPMSFAQPAVLPIEEELQLPRNAEPTAMAVVFDAIPNDATERNFVVEPTPPVRSPMVPLAIVVSVVLMALVVLRVGFPAGDHAKLPVVVTQNEPVVQPAAAVEATSAQPTALPPAAEPAPVAVAPAPVAVAPTPARAPIMLAPTFITPTPVAKPAAAAEWKPEVIEVGGQPTVLVPIGGSSSGMTHFLLDKPAGVAVDFPKGTPAVTAKPYLLHHALFHSLWVRKMETGMQIRLHADKGVKLAVDVVDGKLRIRRKE